MNNAVITKNITMIDCDVIHLAKGEFHAPFSLLCIMSNDGSGQQSHTDYLFENIRLEDYCAIVGINHTVATLRNIRFRTMASLAPPKSPSQVRGVTIDAKQAIVFENLTSVGRVVTRAEDVPLKIAGESAHVVFLAN